MSGGSKKKQTVGHRYFRTMTMSMCHGRIDAVRSLWFKEKLAWSGNARFQENGETVVVGIDKTSLFGGNDKEGGVRGAVEIGHGAFNQVLKGVNPDGTTTLAPIRSLPHVKSPWQPIMGCNYRGMAVVTFHDFYWGVSPYIGDVSMEVERYWNDWYPETAKIGVDANPAHIIYETITNDQWGLGYSSSQLNDEAFRAAAVQLHSEGLGLSQTWSAQQSIEDFIGTVLKQIDATFYFDPAAGQWTIKLVRAGDPAELVLDPNNCRLTSFRRRGAGETVNELVGQWVNPETEEFESITVHDTASIMAIGQTISGTQTYPGVRSEALAGQLILRDLKALSSTLALAEVTANRQASKLNPGSTVVLNWPAHGIEGVRMRVTSVSTAQLSADVKLSLVEDVFGQSLGSFTGVNPPGWVDERREATQFDVLAVFELPYWFVFNGNSGITPEPEYGYASVLGVTANDSIMAATLFRADEMPSGTVLEEVDTGPRTPSARIATAITKGLTSPVTVMSGSFTGIREVGLDSLAVLGVGETSEIVRVIGTASTEGFTIVRGLMDTFPRDWPAGTRIYFIGDGLFPADTAAHSLGATIDYRLTMETSLSALDPAEVPVTTVGITARQGRPYPVANVTVGGTYWPSAVTVTNRFLNVSWSTRNRLLQNSNTHLRWDEASVPPEAGTEVLVMLTRSGVVLDSVLVTDPSQNTALIPVHGLANGATRVIVRTMRDAFDNYQDYEHDFTLTVASVPYVTEANNPGGNVIAEGTAYQFLPLYTEVKDELDGWDTDTQRFTPPVAGNYRIQATVVPVRTGTNPMPAGTTFRLGFGSVAADGPNVVSGTSPNLSAFTLSLDQTVALSPAETYTIFCNHDAATPIAFTSASLKITEVL